jgi:hypothetical protein
MSIKLRLRGKMNEINGYKVFYSGSRASLDVYAKTSFEAHKKAVAFFKVTRKKEHLITVVLCEKAGEQYERENT